MCSVSKSSQLVDYEWNESAVAFGDCVDLCRFVSQMLLFFLGVFLSWMQCVICLQKMQGFSS
jgi:hypothetical protein